ncbi:hypothetical protein ETC05_12120 [Geobacillus sp. BMUD]|nr:hypothetical protein [Geobacillus sp. BMUD]
MNRTRSIRYMQFMAASLLALFVLYLAMRKHVHALEHTSVLLSLTIVFPLYLAVVYQMTIGRIKRSWKEMEQHDFGRNHRTL